MSTSVDAAVLAYLENDKKTALSVLNAAREQMQLGYVDPVPMDITGAPKSLGEFRQYKERQQVALFEINRDLFYRKVEVEVIRPHGDHENRKYLFTKGRYVTGIQDEDWYLVSWTIPVAQKVRDAEIGTTVERERPGTMQVEKMTVRARGIYDGTLLPRITEVTYELDSGSIYIDDEDRFVSVAAIEVAPTVKPEQEYEAAEDFGLHEIITLADATQWDAMHLPFKDTVLVEGPPGSGKTSIGLMRVPCLIDRQWEELNLKPEEDLPFHVEQKMRVLVMNEEMIEYLSRLIRSVGVQGLIVEPMGKFCRRLCRDSGTLRGRTVRESPELTLLKHHPLAIRAIWAGLVKSVDTLWASGIEEPFAQLRSINPDFTADLIRRLNTWKGRLLEARDPDGEESTVPNLADVLRRWQENVERSIPPHEERPAEAQARREELRALREEIKRVIRTIFDRARLVDSMQASDEFGALLAASGLPADNDAVQEWRQQTEHEVQQISDGDLLLHAQLASRLMLVRSNERSVPFGAINPLLTHVVIDEAQDIAAGHVKLIRRLLHPDGTLTLVGDLRQRVSHTGFFHGWEDLGLGEYTRAVFAVNHRQSRPLGAFLSDLHRCLFGAVPDWEPSERREAPLPRIRPKRGYGGMANLVAAEVRYWREEIPNATVGVLFHGERWNQARRFAQRIEEALGDTLTEVRVASARDSGQLSRTDCATIASVENTKGLEFDAVVFIDRHQDWKGPIAEVAEIRRNGLYVAASRAKQGLSLLLDDRCELLDGGLSSELYDLVPVAPTGETGDEEASDFEEDDATEEEEG